MNVTKISPAQQAALNALAIAPLTADLTYATATWKVRNSAVRPATLQLLVNRGLVVRTYVDSRTYTFSLPVADQPLPEQQQAEALPVATADTMRAAQDAQQRAYKLSRRERMALAEAALEALDTEAAQALKAEHMARHAEEDAIARSLQALDVALLDSTPVAPGSFVRPDYCATPGAQVAAWNSANRALRAVMAQAAMWEANRIKGAGKYLGLRNIFTFRQLRPSELHALRLAILSGALTQNWELCQSRDDEPAMAQRIDNVDAEDFARIMAG